MLSILKRVFFWGLFLTALITEALLLKTAPFRAMLLLAASQLIMIVWMLVCLYLAKRVPVQTDKSVARKVNSDKLWEKYYVRNDVPWLLCYLLFALSVVELTGNWHLGALFIVAQWTFFTWYNWLCRSIRRTFEDAAEMELLQMLKDEDCSDENNERGDDPRS